MLENLGPTLLALWVALYPFILGGGIGVLVLWLYNKYSASDDNKYKLYYPLAIQAVKIVEKSIPDDTENTPLKKADLFLKEFIRLVTEQEGKPVDENLKRWALRVKELILLELEKNNNI